MSIQVLFCRVESMLQVNLDHFRPPGPTPQTIFPRAQRPGRQVHWIRGAGACALRQLDQTQHHAGLPQRLQGRRSTKQRSTESFSGDS